MAKYLKIGSVGIAFMLAGAVVLLYWQVNNLKSEKAALEWELVTVEAETDTIFITGEYAVDTLWRTITRTITDTLSGKIDTVYEDIPVISGDISFDTTIVFGEDFNPLSITASGRFWYPEEFSYCNWLLIVPEFGKPPYLPVTPRTPRRWGIGLGLLGSSTGAISPGFSIRRNHTSIALYRQLNRNVWTLGLNYEILSF